MGGMALPNFVSYYWSANIKAMLYWAKRDDTTLPWVAKERTSTGLVSLVSLLCAKLPLLGLISSLTLSLLVIHSLEIWYQFRRHFALTELSLVAPPQGHGMFTPSITDGAFSVWLEYEVRSIYDLFIGNVCRNSEQLVQRLNIPRAHFYWYLQLQNCIACNVNHVHHHP